MNILLVTMDSLENNTSANIRNMGLVRGLKKNGHQISTLSLQPDKNSYSYDESIGSLSGILNERYFFPADGLYQKMRAKKTGLSGSKTTLKQGIRNIANQCFVYDVQKVNVKNAGKLKLDISRFDIIISSSDPKSAHLIVEALYKKYKKNGSLWIQYWGDPMLNDITTKASHIKRFLIKKEEKRILNLADFIVYTSPFTLRAQQNHYQRHQDKMMFCIQSAPPISQHKKPVNIPPVLGYFGNYDSNVRNLNPLCEAVKILNVTLVVAGSGDLNTQAENILIHPKLSYKESVELEKQSDILVCICNRHGTQIPGKIYYTAAHQKPIIVITDGEFEDKLILFFRQFNRYILCTNQVHEIEAAIKQAVLALEKDISYTVPEQMKDEYLAARIMNRIHSTNEI